MHVFNQIHLSFISTKTLRFTPYILILSIFLILISPYWLSDGMFVDGVTYATISRNLSLEYFNFWQLHYTHTLAPEFYGHLPFAIWLQSLWFLILGDTIYVERVYSFVCHLLTGGVMMLIWKEITNSFRFSWISLVFWISVPEVSWACSNNVLENTVTFFMCCSILFYLQFEDSKKHVLLILSGMFLFLAVFSKGPMPLFLLCLPFLISFFIRKKNLKSVFVEVGVILLCLTLPFLMIWNFCFQGSYFLAQYYEEQLLLSFLKERTVANRFEIAMDFLQNSIPALLLLVFIFGSNFVFRPKAPPRNHHLKMAGILILLTLCGVLPLMTIMKQSSFYLLPLYPIFALGLSLLVIPAVERFTTKFYKHETCLKILMILAGLLFLIAIILNFMSIHQISRDKEQVQMANDIAQLVQSGTLLSTDDVTSQDWLMHAYLSRLGNVSLELDANKMHNYTLICRQNPRSTHLANNSIVAISSQSYILLNKK